ncbi:MAG TPA: DoxX family protein [Stellaceae bacterium]|nr:DoxX family protein [Stellaceae bacterium]
MVALNIEAANTSQAALWTGRVLTAIVALFLVLDSGMKLLQLDAVRQAMQPLGYPDHLGLVIGIIEAICLVLYVVPRTAVLGAILLTGLLGGSAAAHLRVGDPLFTHVLFGVYVGILAWGGLYLRDATLRALIPFHR